MSKKISYWFYDLEVFSNFFMGYFLNRETGEEKYFIIHESKNDIVELMTFLRSLLPTKNSLSWMIGFNNMNYDYPIIHFILTKLIKMKYLYDNPIRLTQEIKKKSDEIIGKDFSTIPDKQILIKQLDPYKIHHFDNKAKRCSLKYLEGVLQMNEIETYDDFSKVVKTKDIPEIIHYCRNDVFATKRFYQESLSDIRMRQELTNQFGINLMNADDPKLGVEIFAKPISKGLGINIYDLKKLRTKRNEVYIEECITPKIKFKTEKFKQLLLNFKRSVVDPKNTKKAIEFKVNYKNIDYHYGVGGLHASIKSGRYKKTETHEIIDIDVASFYTAIAIKNQFYPKHLSKVFYESLKSRFEYRLSIKKDPKMKAIAGGWKLALNGVYGKSQSEFSYFYDPKYTFSITVNGQLYLTMLVEAISENIDDCQVLQVNTDGITVYINKEKKEQMMKICKDWESYTELTLEYTNYREMCISDVNNYLAIKDYPEEDLRPQFDNADWYDNKYTKHKTIGCYQVIPTRNGKIAYDANWDFRIIQKAVYDYFVFNIPIKETIIKSTNIYDFLGIAKFNSAYYSEFTKSDGTKERLGKVVRYYCSSGGGRLQKVRKRKLKKDEKGSNQNDIQAKQSVTIMNKIIKHDNFKNYNIDYTFYIREANKLINRVEKIEQKTLTIF